MRNGAETQITIAFIRHGETKSNREHRYLGKTEEFLLEEGTLKLHDYKKQRKYSDITHLFCSPMKRCLETAGILYPDKMITIIPEWKEMDFGDFEGKNHIELQDDECYQKWIDSNGTLPFPNGESKEAFTKRCESGFERMLRLLLQETDKNFQKEIIEPGQNKVAAAIVHGGTIMALLSSFYGGEYFDYQVKNGEGYICIVSINAKETRITSIKSI